MNDDTSRVRPAEPGDVREILAMVRELADYERAANEVRTNEEQLEEALFGARPQVFAHVATEGGTVVGFALWFVSYSTWLGRHGLYLEDLFVRPRARGRGHGAALMQALATVCVERGYGRFEWSVLDWNTPAIAFYEGLGAVGMSEWTVHRLTGDALARLAAGDQGR